MEKLENSLSFEEMYLTICLLLTTSEGLGKLSTRDKSLLGSVRGVRAVEERFTGYQDELFDEAIKHVQGRYAYLGRL